MYNATFREKPKRTNAPMQLRNGEKKMTKFEEELSSLPVSYSTKYAKFWNKAELLTVFKDWQPQQALPVVPVVPDDVAEWIEILKTKGLKPLDNPETHGGTGFTEEKLLNILFWISEHQEDYMRAWLDGYQVEKPQLFYLKNKLTGLYLYKKPLGGYGEEFANYIKDLTNDFKFTQKEIDGMDVQSYEKKDEYKGE